MIRHEIFFNERYKEKGIEKADYIATQEYIRRLHIIQPAVHEVLREGDKLFGVNDGIEGLLIIGSYGRSFPDFGSRIWVHEANKTAKASDLDIAPIESGRKIEFDKKMTQQKVYESTGIKIDEIDLGLNKHIAILLEKKLQEKGLSLAVQKHPWFDLNLSDPSEFLENLSDNISPEETTYTVPIHGAGLLFMANNSPYLEKTISMFKAGKLPVIRDPLTPATANRIK
jgi:hypothetical protein